MLSFVERSSSKVVADFSWTEVDKSLCTVAACELMFAISSSGGQLTRMLMQEKRVKYLGMR